MLDINQYFFWQLINFFLLFIILNQMLFKPFMRLFKERQDRTEGALSEARALDEKKDDVLKQIDAKLAGARDRAKTAFEDLSQEGMDIQKHALEAAQSEAAEINKKARAELKDAAEKARASLKSDVEAFAKQIVEKVIAA